MHARRAYIPLITAFETNERPEFCIRSSSSSLSRFRHFATLSVSSSDRFRDVPERGDAEILGEGRKRRTIVQKGSLSLISHSLAFSATEKRSLPHLVCYRQN